MMHCSAATPSVNTPSLFTVFGYCGLLLGMFECSHSQLFAVFDYCGLLLGMFECSHSQLFTVFGYCGLLLGVFDCSHSQLVYCIWLLWLAAGSV